MKHRHHIIPKHMGGDNSPENLVEVSIEEHAELHLALYLEYGKWEDWRAAWGLSGCREEMYEAHSVAMSGENNPMFGLKGENHPAYGYKYTEEQRKRRSENLTANNPMQNPEYRKKVSQAAKKHTNHVKSYIITYTNGEVRHITNLAKWCRDNGYNKAGCRNLLIGAWKKYKDLVSIQPARRLAGLPNP